MVFLVGLLGIFVTVGLHAAATTLVLAYVQRHALSMLQRLGRRARPLVLGTATCLLAFKHYVDVVLWAVVFWFLVPDQFADFESAVYFSSVTYTSLGYGDSIITGHWRILSGFLAMNGMLLFGLSSALLFVLAEQLWFHWDRWAARIQSGSKT